MRYADYEFYVSNYCGKLIPERDFGFAAERASDRINESIFDRDVPEKYMESVKHCCCELAEQIYRIESNNKDSGGAVASEHIGSYSISYRSGSELIETAGKLDDICYSIISRHLSGTGLLYRGVD